MAYWSNVKWVLAQNWASLVNSVNCYNLFGAFVNGDFGVLLEIFDLLIMDTVNCDGSYFFLKVIAEIFR